eukprot:4778004-Amphidinium_carterae.1
MSAVYFFFGIGKVGCTRSQSPPEPRTFCDSSTKFSSNLALLRLNLCNSQASPRHVTVRSLFITSMMPTMYKNVAVNRPSSLRADVPTSRILNKLCKFQYVLVSCNF